MTQEELDKLAEKYQDDNTIIRYYGPGNGTVPEYNKTMAEVFKDGWNSCMEQMMKEATEHYVIGVIAGSPVGPAIVHYDDNLTIGDKVKVIIVKED